MTEAARRPPATPAFRFEAQDPERYRRTSRRVGLAMAAQLLVFGLLFSQLLVRVLGSGIWVNALGVALGVVATGLIFAWLRGQPWMGEVRYVWRLKQQLSRLSAHLPALRRGLADDDPRALDALAFYHQGMTQLAELEGRTLDDDAEALAERLEVRRRRAACHLPERVDGFEPRDLEAFRRG